VAQKRSGCRVPWPEACIVLNCPTATIPFTDDDNLHYFPWLTVNGIVAVGQTIIFGGNLRLQFVTVN
jgi:hypothetical protein